MGSKLKIIKDFKKRNILFNLQNKLKFNKLIIQNRIFPKYLYYLNNINTYKSIINNRCVFSGRSKSVYRHVRLTRMVFKYLAINGLLHGINKISW